MLEYAVSIMYLIIGEVNMRKKSRKKIEKYTRIVALFICIAMVLGIVIPFLLGA